MGEEEKEEGNEVREGKEGKERAWKDRRRKGGNEGGKRRERAKSESGK